MPLADLDFSQRANLVERMDDPCSYEDLHGCLHDIARVNRLTFAYRPTISWMQTLVVTQPSSVALRVVDIGCGHGDMLRKIHTWACRSGVPVTLTGIDLNPDAIRVAKESTLQTQPIQWIVGDALSDAVPGEIDIIVSSLLAHHLTNPQIIQFLRWMDQRARLGWFINDLHRQPVPYHLFRLLSRFTNWHPFVRYDGPVSIRRSFRREDWQSLCTEAGLPLETITIQGHRPARLCVGRIK